MNTQQQAEFKRACVEDGVDPKAQCPLCRTDVDHVAPLYDLRDPSHDWAEKPVSDEYQCPSCRLSYRVRRPTPQTSR